MLTIGEPRWRILAFQLGLTFSKYKVMRKQTLQAKCDLFFSLHLLGPSLVCSPTCPTQTRHARDEDGGHAVCPDPICTARWTTQASLLKAGLGHSWPRPVRPTARGVRGSQHLGMASSRGGPWRSSFLPSQAHLPCVQISILYAWAHRPPGS